FQGEVDHRQFGAVDPGEIEGELQSSCIGHTRVPFGNLMKKQDKKRKVTHATRRHKAVGA
ncbi:MAG: hypothetical protein ABN479_03305, partial [Billgrantia sp.]